MRRGQRPTLSEELGADGQGREGAGAPRLGQSIQERARNAGGDGLVAVKGEPLQDAARCASPGRGASILRTRGR